MNENALKAGRGRDTSSNTYLHIRGSPLRNKNAPGRRANSRNKADTQKINLQHVLLPKPE